MTCVVFDADGFPVTPELVLAAYRDRCFPHGGRTRRAVTLVSPADSRGD